MLFRIVVSVLLATLMIGCSPTAQPTPTPAPTKSKLAIDSFLVAGQTGGKSESIRVRAGDTIKTEIEVSGLQSDSNGKSVGTVSLTLGGPDFAAIQLEPRAEDFEKPYAHGGKVTLSPSITIGPTDPPGERRLRVVVVDKAADLEVEKQVVVFIESGEPANEAPQAPTGTTSDLTPSALETSVDLR